MCLIFVLYFSNLTHQEPEEGMVLMFIYFCSERELITFALFLKRKGAYYISNRIFFQVVQDFCLGGAWDAPCTPAASNSRGLMGRSHRHRHEKKN